MPANQNRESIFYARPTSMKFIPDLNLAHLTGRFVLYLSGFYIYPIPIGSFFAALL